jgi:protein phosphatase
VGHYPVMLYSENIVTANPIIDRERHIACIDGACVLKDDGQLNCLIIPDITAEELSFTAYDPFPLRTVLNAQRASERSAYIRWGDSRVQVLERGEEFSRCRHVRTGYELDILTKYLFEDGEFTDCNDCTDYVLPLSPGDRVGVVEKSSRGYFVKHEGVSGWYYGALSEE